MSKGEGNYAAAESFARDKVRLMLLGVRVYFRVPVQRCLSAGSAAAGFAGHGINPLCEITSEQLLEYYDYKLSVSFPSIPNMLIVFGV